MNTGILLKPEIYSLLNMLWRDLRTIRLAIIHTNR